MMVFNHLFDNKRAIGLTFLVSYNFGCVMKNTEAWTIWTRAVVPQHGQHTFTPLMLLQYASMTECIRTRFFKRFAMLESGEFSPIRWLRTFCSTGNYSALIILWKHYAIPHDDVRRDEAFLYACRGGYLKIARWVRRTYLLRSQDILSKECNAFMVACGGGHLTVAQWLHSIARVTIDAGFMALRFACCGGHLSVVKWLHEVFNFSKGSICQGHNKLLQSACRDDRLDVVKWLFSTFELGSKEAIECYDSMTYNEFGEMDGTWFAYFHRDIKRELVESDLVTFLRRKIYPEQF